MGKNIKSYATFPQSISPGKRREALQQKRPNAQIFLFKYGTVLLYTFISKFTSKIFQLRTLAKFQRIRQILLNLPTDAVNYAKFAPIIDPFTLCFRYLPRQRTLRNSSELCKFRAIRPQLPRIT